eukprot:snap_masked-scaffold_14-processed-gene-3.37-mRNA-1 protein AED:0.09 eAED:0.09 QI:0/0/0/1/1/1/3/0/369
MGARVTSGSKQKNKDENMEYEEENVDVTGASGGIENKNNVYEVYQVGTAMGEGSFAEVFEGVHRKKNIRVAIKKIDRSSSADDVVLKEINLMNLVKNEKCVNFFEYFQTPDYFYLVLEHMAGGELFDYVVAKEYLSEREAAKIVQQMGMALEYLDSISIVHRDVKPENILFLDRGNEINVKLTDFGLADQVSGPGKEDLTSPCGTPGYVAPEILLMKRYGSKVDVWGMGVILYILLCGYPPFYAERQDELFQQIKLGKYEFKSPYWDQVSEGAKTTITKLLVVNPANRTNAAEMVQLPWVKYAAEQSTDVLGDHVVKGIIEVKKNEKFRKIALAIKVINSFAPRESDNAAAAFARKLKDTSIEEKKVEG